MNDEWLAVQDAVVRVLTRHRVLKNYILNSYHDRTVVFENKHALANQKSFLQILSGDVDGQAAHTIYLQLRKIFIKKLLF